MYELGLACHIRQELEAPTWIDPPYTLEMAVAWNPTLFQLGGEGEDEVLLPPTDDPLQLKAPLLHIRLTEPKLAERNLHFDGPASIGDLGFGGPDGIP